jgi:hypothetical protein
MTSNIVRPLQIASEKLLDALGTIRLRARNEGRECRLQDSEVVRALVNFRNAVWMLTPSTNQALKGYLFRLDQILDQIRDRMLQILVERLFRGEMTAEEGAMAVALLKQAAESGSGATLGGTWIAWKHCPPPAPSMNHQLDSALSRSIQPGQQAAGILCRSTRPRRSVRHTYPPPKPSAEPSLLYRELKGGRRR